MIGPRAAPAVLEHNIEICPVDLRLNLRRSNSFSGGAPSSLRVVVIDGSFIRSAEEHCMLLRYRCRFSPSFLLLRHTTENTSSSAQASSSWSYFFLLRKREASEVRTEFETGVAWYMDRPALVNVNG